MKFISSVIKAGIAKKVFDVASKPQNQAKVKAMLSKRKQSPSR